MQEEVLLLYADAGPLSDYMNKTRIRCKYKDAS
jgi:hypothetical protein